VRARYPGHNPVDQHCVGGDQMTTKHSSLSQLKAQADYIAQMLKAFERGEKIDVKFAEKIEAARGKETFKIGIVMDDKVITLDIPWSTLRGTSETGLALYILNQMRETRVTIN
jgi:hypothetical protein